MRDCLDDTGIQPTPCRADQTYKSPDLIFEPYSSNIPVQTFKDNWDKTYHGRISQREANQVYLRVQNRSTQVTKPYKAIVYVGGLATFTNPTTWTLVKELPLTLWLNPNTKAVVGPLTWSRRSVYEFFRDHDQNGSDACFFGIIVPMAADDATYSKECLQSQFKSVTLMQWVRNNANVNWANFARTTASAARFKFYAPEAGTHMLSLGQTDLPPGTKLTTTFDAASRGTPTVQETEIVGDLIKPLPLTQVDMTKDQTAQVNLEVQVPNGNVGQVFSLNLHQYLGVNLIGGLHITHKT